MPGSFFSRLEDGNGQQEVRTVLIDGEPWFVAKDVCEVLGLSNPSMAIDALDDDERARFKLGRQGDAWVISEAGLYSLTIRSRKPEAKLFKTLTGTVCRSSSPNRTQVMGHVPDEWEGSAQVATLSLIAVITTDVIPHLPVRNFAPGYPRRIFGPAPPEFSGRRPPGFSGR